MSFRCPAILLLIAACVCAVPARAASFCVSSVAGLANALTYYDTGASSDETVTIRLVQGTYAVGASLNRYYGGAGANDDVNLKLLGGYTTNCASRQPDPRNTVLDGNNVVNSGIGLKMHGTGSLLVEGLTFTRFTGSTSMAGMVNASTVGEVLLINKDFASESDDSVYEVRQSRFVRNGGQAMVNMTGSLVRFVDNVVADNALSSLTSFGFSGAFVVTLDADVDAAVTLTNNTVTGTTGGPGVLIQTLITGDSGRLSEVSDNILWNNAGTDIVFTGTAEHVYPLLSSYNLYGSANSNYPQSSSDLHVDPRFVDAAGGNYRLASNSPAINRGAFLQLQGFPARDADGAARIVGSRIDIGAYESTIDDTTTAVVTT
ncbi:MAG TPA: choice-of-anchor Q domain-containing protein, partial [Tahibacter sp.]|nr:choice-of-anchor Q domain-containing protein [Tahibacter sp.]